jgi:hypothetical protein
MVAEWHREHPIVGVKSQENTPQLNPGSVPTIANQGSSEPPATVPKESGKRSKTSSSGAIVQENNGGSNNTNTQIGTAQGPIAIAPNGIANAAPNLGSQSVTNNFVPPPRTIPPDVRAECLELLSGTHGKVSVNALMGDSEGFNYAKQWYDLFAAAHWEMADDQVGKLMEVGTVTQGIEVRFHGEHVTMPRQPLVVPSFLVPVVNCIEKLGPKPVGNPFPDMPENEIFFLVGNRPN